MGVKGWRNFTQPLYELPKGPEWQFGMQLSLSVTETLSCLIPILWSRALVGTSSIVGIKCAILHVHKSWIHWNLYVSYVVYRINISTIGAMSRSYYMYMSWFWPNSNTPLNPTTLFCVLTSRGRVSRLFGWRGKVKCEGNLASKRRTVQTKECEDTSFSVFWSSSL